MLIVHVPPTYPRERSYIVQTLLKDFLGLDFQQIPGEHKNVSIENTSVAGDSMLEIADILFQTPQNQWLTQSSLPKQPLAEWDTTEFFQDVPLVSPRLPVIYGRKFGQEDGSAKSYLLRSENVLYLGLDIFGSAFFVLSRYEELVKTGRDEHDRFPARESLAYQAGFLNRPIANEYLEILWWCLKGLWPGLERKKWEFRMVLSHDIDAPFAQAFAGISKLVRNCGGDILRRKSPFLALKRIKSWVNIKRGDYRQDLNYTFDWLMDVSEQNGIKSAFYFKTASTDPRYDNSYPIEHPYIRQLLRDIYSRGHEIGLHPSYKTYQDLGQTKKELHKLLQVCEEEGIQQNRWGGRQHYLRWQAPTTWRNWAEAGLSYDSTLSYAAHAGFRCGICYEYTVYDLEHRRPLPLQERPLVVMEGSVIGEQYMYLKKEAALNYILTLKKHCRLFEGDFTLLWHNSSFETRQMREMYKTIIKG